MEGTQWYPVVVSSHRPVPQGSHAGNIWLSWVCSGSQTIGETELILYQVTWSLQGL